ncbi:amino acid-binding protein [Alteromonas sp. KUL156]|uniref:ACT domain-containing protein n=1 Tax=Alteromonas sp. KUL106 TaxID=2480799 RepID=UPI0012E4FF36|nr:ACT domain-containing protein [Alteromonas sp. KUL106]GFD68826.1 amino acid-binding protein [Alteromonas sp. KUL106]GFD80053.1 amino acid-binding protein [Tenacibaculum sp. KUL118]GFD95778.1 amino acid-binding protein [Alteromonas sp. KUL154]GFE02021.1 amino acid-binding protein [Alteromonas sp. KUL156]
MPKQTLLVRESLFTIHSLDPQSAIPASVLNSPLFFLGKTEDELSIVVPDSVEVDSLDSDEGWRALELLGPLHLSMVGIMAQIGEVLASAKVAIFVVSTFETDFFLVKDTKLKAAINALKKAGYTVNEDH